MTNPVGKIPPPPSRWIANSRWPGCPRFSEAPQLEGFCQKHSQYSRLAGEAQVDILYLEGLGDADHEFAFEKGAGRLLFRASQN
jgi:hypothetical protein